MLRSCPNRDCSVRPQFANGHCARKRRHDATPVGRLGTENETGGTVLEKASGSLRLATICRKTDTADCLHPFRVPNAATNSSTMRCLLRVPNRPRALGHASAIRCRGQPVADRPAVRVLRLPEKFDHGSGRIPPSRIALRAVGQESAATATANKPHARREKQGWQCAENERTNTTTSPTLTSRLEPKPGHPASPKPVPLRIAAPQMPACSAPIATGSDCRRHAGATNGRRPETCRGTSR